MSKRKGVMFDDEPNAGLYLPEDNDVKECVKEFEKEARELGVSPQELMCWCVVELRKRRLGK